MANPRRVLRLQQLILETVAQYIQREVRDPRIGMVSITRVKLAPDLSTAAIGWSCLGDDAAHRKTARGLEDAAASIQRAVAQALQTRTTPRIHFRHDDTLEKAQELETIFEQLREEKRAHGELVDEDAESEAPTEDKAGGPVEG
ncbi:MAG: 30S ribosome-binding factor RbfA [Planctomycetota bacterium]|nr:30S ribosome-binding factor RbfA [Planctomycetota bacterium]